MIKVDTDVLFTMLWKRRRLCFFFIKFILFYIAVMSTIAAARSFRTLDGAAYAPCKVVPVEVDLSGIEGKMSDI